MPTAIPNSHLRLLTDPVVAHLATVMPDGRPQVNPGWCDYDGTYISVNAAADRQKTRNMRQRTFATLLLADGLPVTFLVLGLGVGAGMLGILVLWAC